MYELQQLFFLLTSLDQSAGDKLEESVKAMNIELQKINECLSFNKLA